MKRGHLSEHFVGLAVKRLTRTETDRVVSSQHEFDGVQGLKAMLGTERTKFPATFTYLADDDPEPLRGEGTLTWYDARENDPKRSEFRLYYTSTVVSDNFSVGDLLILARRPDDRLIVVIAEAGSTMESQLQWLFGVGDVSNPDFSVKGEIESGQSKLDFAANHILELIGEKVEVVDETFLDVMLRKFGGGFPKTRDFSKFARSTLKGLDDIGDPDGAMMAWMEREEILFRTLERHQVGEALRSFSSSWDGDPDGWLDYAKSVFQRRRSRVGYALENHLEHLFTRHRLTFSRGKVSEGSSKPDFIMPSIEAYRDPGFDPALLTMLGVKATCRDRWRQVLAEAKRIPEKHLYTLEGSISVTQTSEMESHALRLVLPRALHATFKPEQQSLLRDTAGFLDMVRDRAAVSSGTGGFALVA